MATREEELRLQRERINRELAHSEAAKALREAHPWLGPYACNPDIFGIDIKFMSLDPEDAKELVQLRHYQRVRRGLKVTGPDPNIIKEPVTQSNRQMDGPTRITTPQVDVAPSVATGPILVEETPDQARALNRS